MSAGCRVKGVAVQIRAHAPEGPLAGVRGTGRSAGHTTAADSLSDALEHVRRELDNS